QFRRAANRPTEEERFALSGPDVIQLERRGDSYLVSVARFGEPFITLQTADIALGDDVYLGLSVCSHNDAVTEQATFQDVRIVVPASDDFIRYKDFLGSNLEILDVDSGHRQIVLQSSDVVEAPNWTPDGKALIYNSNGRLYRFDLAEKTSKLIDTGFAN